MNILKISLLVFILSNSVSAQEGWFLQNPITPEINYRSTYFLNGNVGYIVGDSGIIIRTLDGGDNWIESNQGLNISKINCFLVVEDGIYAGTEDQGIYYSSDNGNSWTSKNNGLSNLSVKTMVIFNARLFIGTDGSGIFYSDNNGEVWTQNNSGLTSWYIKHLSLKDDKLFVSTGLNFCISENNGQNWSALSTPFEYPVLCSTVYEEYMFVGTNGDGVAYSMDYGQTWTLWSEGLSNLNMYAIEVFGDYVWSPSCCGFGLYKRLLPDVTNIVNIDLTNDVEIYPNPSTDIIKLKSSQNITHLKIFNMQGRLMIDKNRPCMESAIDVSKLTRGIYLVILNFGELNTTRKLIIL